jgi:hypothetical protein
VGESSDDRMPYADWLDCGWMRQHPPYWQERELRRIRVVLAERGDDFATVLELLTRADPMRLIAAGAPPHEYMHEAEHVDDRLGEAQSTGDVRDIVHDVMAKSFGPMDVGTPARYEPLAEEFWRRRRTA